MTDWKTIISAADSDDMVWTLEQDHDDGGRFRLKYGRYDEKPAVSTVNFTQRARKRSSSEREN